MTQLSGTFASLVRLRRKCFGRTVLVLTFFFILASDTNGQSLPEACATFTDASITANETLVKAIHLSELRSCIEALRLDRGLGLFSWTDPTLTPQVTVVRAIHLAELRVALEPVYARGGQGAPEFTDAIPGIIRAIHILELRNAAQSAPPSCEYVVNPTSHTIGSDADEVTFNVVTEPGCPWIAQTVNEFLQITTTESGAGPGSVTYSASANTSVEPRDASLTIADKTVTVNQSGACSFSVGPPDHNLPATAGSFLVSVFVAEGCEWQTQQSSSFLTLVGNSTRTGPDVVTYTFSANSLTTPRSTQLTVAGTTIGVTQAGGEPQPPDYALRLLFDETQVQPPSVPNNMRLSGSGVAIDGESVGCQAELILEPGQFPVSVGISLVAYDPENNPVASSFVLNQNQATTTVYFDLTMTGQYACAAQYYVNGELVVSDSSGFNVAVLVADITINAFIPEALSIHPLMPFVGFLGDNRSFDIDGPYRTTQRLSLLEPKARSLIGADPAPFFDTGMSTAMFYAGPSIGLVIAERKASTDGMRCDAGVVSATRVNLNCSGDSANPFAPSWPPVVEWFASVTYIFSLDFEYSPEGVSLIMSAEHDGYPNYEVYVGNQRVYDYDHGSNTPLVLGGGMDVNQPFVFRIIE